MTTEPVRLARLGRLARVTLDRPPLQVLDLATLAALDRALAGLAGDPVPQVVVVESAGERAFSAGVAVEDHAPDRIGEMLATFHGALSRLRDLPAVSIAAVRGYCLGGGMELAAACDLIVAADDAVFGQPEIDLGCFPPYAAALYPGLVGPRRALDWLLTGRRFGAAEAAAAGLVARLAPAAELDAAVDDLAAAIATKSAAVTRLIKKAVGVGSGLPFEPALAACERIYLEDLAATADMAEGIAAFVARRPPHWRHE